MLPQARIASIQQIGMKTQIRSGRRPDHIGDLIQILGVAIRAAWNDMRPLAQDRQRQIAGVAAIATRVQQQRAIIVRATAEAPASADLNTLAAWSARKCSDDVIR